MKTASVVGASGFTGGELLRLLESHPEFEVVQATSRSYENKTVGSVHPNLRGMGLRFSDPGDLESVDVLFACTPHGVSMEHIDAYREAADTVVDLSADFRLDSEAQYEEYYDGHDRPELLADAEYALPELNRENLRGADIVASGGCNATAAILGLKPLFDDGILGGDERIVVDVKVGSSEGGAGGGEASSHPERSGVVRPYAPTGHRHEAEIEQFLGTSVSFTAHAVDMTRGASATCHVYPDSPVSKGDLWGAFRESYEDEPFVRLVAGGSGVYRYPEPKAVAGSNYAEVGFELDPGNRRVVVFSAIDNMMKGSAGQAVHAANVALGFEETAGLEFTGLHPVGAP
ncbi:N-acetyl-gamma-glutamyl-phosphate reductase [Natronomonas marina]|uniref:N-acetyl-gamma-glutamyl-phosphate reductase n=1 Tax=Natronomonas marina TaxID=2961939 RepID=UPI0020C9500B|nr:N-acetyl-gamma-glutamyl-phosphate reductase [Natronomonas marina]